MDEKATWTTRFDHNKKQIIHTFPSGRLVAIADRKDDSFTVYKDGTQIKKCENLTMGDYYVELLTVSNADTVLSKLPQSIDV